MFCRTAACRAAPGTGTPASRIATPPVRALIRPNPAQSPRRLRLHKTTRCSSSSSSSSSSAEPSRTRPPYRSQHRLLENEDEIPEAAAAAAAAPRLLCERKPPDGGRPITVTWTSDIVRIAQDGLGGRRTASLNPAALRDSCACGACRDASSGQKTFASVEIPPDIGFSHVRAAEDGLAVSFANDIERFARQAGGRHETTVPWASIEAALQRRGTHDAAALSRRKRSVLARTGVRYWDRQTLAKHVRKIDYAEFMKPESPSFWNVVVDILRLGIVYLRNVPRDERSVVRIATRIANIRETLYGRTFDVRAKPDAENVAYTSGHLGLHQDLCYLSPPPMVQILHCMDNSCSGGESLFSDGERAGRLLWPFVRTSSRLAPLAEHRVPYQYDKRGYLYHADRSVVDRDADGAFAGVYWSPPFQGRYEDASVDLERWLAPARVFEALINHPDAVHSYKMEPGECVLFDNLRTMHGRNAFDADAGGARWLRGAYIAAEDFLSRAAYIPAGQAELYRGPEAWTPEKAQKELSEGDWHRDVVERVRRIDPSVEG
ncbi:uncharacterized protein UV8b_06634 [Ustilaginoidea virens]|uniref:TauD/TfdA-like domain-containing protein n=1 Tax=Ustilaginoidea virens TaxID=1159556 RepID=A0A8E5HVQ0_USTVR|nr:uncharacterized protein UV8b_06634 [Ustilaginoidea virens]QUC22393.1 hypothetical protein UV8b_06634 [Ustilaginoidea virens]